MLNNVLPEQPNYLNCINPLVQALIFFIASDSLAWPDILIQTQPSRIKPFLPLLMNLLSSAWTGVMMCPLKLCRSEWLRGNDCVYLKKWRKCSHHLVLESKAVKSSNAPERLRRDGIPCLAAHCPEVKQFRGVELNLGTLLCKCRCLCMRQNQGDSRGLIQTSTPHSYCAGKRSVGGSVWDDWGQLPKISPAISEAVGSKATVCFFDFSLATLCSRVYLRGRSHKQHSDSACVHCFIYFCTSFPEHWWVDKKVWLYRNQPTSSELLCTGSESSCWDTTDIGGIFAQLKLTLSLPFVFVLVTLLNKSTSAFRRVFIFMLFSCISLSNCSRQYGHFHTSDIFHSVWHSPAFTTAETPDFSPTMGSGRIKQ